MQKRNGIDANPVSQTYWGDTGNRCLKQILFFLRNLALGNNRFYLRNSLRQNHDVRNPAFKNPTRKPCRIKIVCLHKERLGLGQEIFDGNDLPAFF